MDLTLTTEQEQVRETLRDFLESKGGIDLARQVMEGDDETVPALWDELSELGYTGVTVPEQYGGFGDDLLFLATILEVAGEVAMPGPYPETTAFVAPLIDAAGSQAQCDRFLSDIQAGETMWSFALYEEENESLPEAIQMGVDSDGEDYVINGTKSLVPYGGMVDEVIVAIRSQNEVEYQGISLFAVPTSDVETTRLHSVDQVRPMYELRFDEVAVSADRLVGPLHGGGEFLRQAINYYSIGTAAMLVGGASRAVDESVEYGNEREQYGQPIGMFQAVKHRTVDMWTDMVQGRWLMYYAAWALVTDDPRANWAVSAATSFCNDRCQRIFRDDMYNHGGMGFTWDYDGHIFLKQASSLERYLGTPTDHLSKLADMSGY